MIGQNKEECIVGNTQKRQSQKRRRRKIETGYTIRGEHLFELYQLRCRSHFAPVVTLPRRFHRLVHHLHRIIQFLPEKCSAQGCVSRYHALPRFVESAGIEETLYTLDSLLNINA